MSFIGNVQAVPDQASKPVTYLADAAACTRSATAWQASRTDVGTRRRAVFGQPRMPTLISASIAKLRWGLSLRRMWALASVVGALGFCQIGGAFAQGAESGPEVSVREALSALQRGDCKLVLSKVAEIVGAATDQRKINNVQRAAALALRASCEARNGNTEAALRDVTASTELASLAPQFWWMRASLARKAAKPEEAIAAIEAMGERSPAALATMPESEITEIVNSVRNRPDPTLYRRLLIVMTRPSYKRENVLESADWLLYEFARLERKAGNETTASELMGRIADPEVQQWASLEPDLKRYFPESYDFAGPVEASIAYLRSYSAEHPRQIGPILKISQHLRRLGKAAEAVEVLRPADPSKQVQQFVDAGRYGSGWWEELARGYRMLGRYDDAVRAYRSEIAWLGGDGAAGVAWANLGHTQLQYGRYAEALKTVSSIEKLKPTIRPATLLEARMIRACALSKLGRRDEAKSDLDFLVAHEAEGRDYVVRGMLCLGRVDQAAGAAVRMLQNPYERSTALRMFSGHAPPLSTTPLYPGEGEMAQVMAHADLKTAIARAGGTRRFNVQAPDF